MADKTKTTIWTKDYICVLFSALMLVLSHSSVNPMVSTYTTYLGAGPKLMGLLTGLFYGIALAMRPVAGPVTTRVDNRKLMMIAYAIGAVVNLGYAAFHTIPMFMLFRFLNGVQYAFVGSLGVTLAANSLPQEKLTSGLGIYGVAGAIAASIAPQIALWLRDWGETMGNPDLGFTFVFLFAAASLLLGLIPLYLMSPDVKDKEALASTGKWYQTILSRHAAFPTVIMFLLIVAYSQFNGYMVPYGEEIGVKQIGMFFTVLSLVMLVTRPVCGSLSDRYGQKLLIIPGTILFAASFFIIGAAKDLTLIIVGAVVAAIGYGAANPSVQSMCIQTETRARRAVASNTIYAGIDLGYFLGPLIGGFIRDVAVYRTVMRFGFFPAALALVVFLLSWKHCSRRLEEVRALEPDA